MRETYHERLVREAAREVALAAMRRIRNRLREAESQPLVERLYEAEWVTEGGAWPVVPMAAREWLSFLLEDWQRAQAEFNACGRY